MRASVRCTHTLAALGLAALSACASPQVRPSTAPAAGLFAPPALPEASVFAEAAPPAADLDAQEAPAAPAPEPAEVAAMTEARGRIVAAAQRLLGKRVRLDCSGYVLASYRAAGVAVLPVPSARRSLGMFGVSARVERPRPGDLAFFHDTYDRNRNGKVDDGITHVALVEAVEGDTVTLLHKGVRVERLRMDLARPTEQEANDPVRVRRARDKAGTRYLAGELFTAFGALLDGPFTQMLQEGPPRDTAGAQHPVRWSENANKSSMRAARRSRSTARPASSSSGSTDASSGSSPSTRRSSSPSSATATRSAPSPHAP